MTIAGSDSGGGAGIQADLKTFAALGVYGTSVVTAVTAQNTTSVLAIAEVPEEVIVHQIDGVIDDIGANAIKTGMLSSTSIIDVVSDRIDAWGITNVVVDPVMVAKSGDALLHPTAVRALVKQLFPLALVVTPNIPEAEALSGMRIHTDEDKRQAARRIAALGASAVIIKGGHYPSTDIVDLLYDGECFRDFRNERVCGTSTHGTGCTFAAALAARLALGDSLEDAVPLVQQYVAGAIRNAPGLGRGHGPMNHFWSVY